MTRFVTITVLAAGVAAAQGNGPWLMESTSLSLAFSRDGSFTVTEKTSGAVWRPELNSRPSVAVRAVEVDRARRALRAAVELDGAPWTLRASLGAAEPELAVELTTAPETALGRALDYPPALKAPGPQYKAVIPHKAGLVFTAADAVARPRMAGRYNCYGNHGLSMPWFGLTDGERGLLELFETPEDAELDLRLSEQSRVFAGQVSWLPARGQAGYARKLRYRFFDQGGYVAMCKHYRDRLVARGEFVTLREKQKARPNLTKLIGAIDLHLRGNDADQVEAVKYLASRGVKKMLLNSGASPETLAWMRQQGYLVGTYKIYTDIVEPRPGRPPEQVRGWVEDAYTRKDGTPVRGFSYPDGRKSTYRCVLRQLPLMDELLPPLIRSHGYEAVFLDVVTAQGPNECYHPAHPIDRREDLRRKVDVLRLAANRGLVTGSEDGNAWAAPHLDYLEGMVMPKRFGYVKGVTVSNWPATFQLDDEYINIDLNERVRAPLWDLAFHDSVVSTWRWNFTPDRYGDPKRWDKHDLFHVLGGDMPIFLVNRKHLETFGDRIVRSYRDCSEWAAKVGWDALLDHRALVPDGSVQQSRFSSGWSVIVNFSEDKPFRLASGEKLAPLSFSTVQGSTPPVR